MKLNFKYLLIGVFIFCVEVMIALFVHDQFIRPYVGDVLVIIMIYAFLKGMTDKPTKRLPIYIFIFAVVVELSQGLNLLELLQLQNSKIASVILGSVFDVKDIVCYAVGMVLLIEWEYWLRKDISYL